MRTRVARLDAGGDGQRGGGPNSLSLYQHDMSAVETARGWETRKCVVVRSACSWGCFERLMGVEDLRIKAKEVSVRGQPRENSSRTVVESVMPRDPFTIQQIVVLLVF